MRPWPGVSRAILMAATVALAGFDAAAAPTQSGHPEIASLPTIERLDAELKEQRQIIIQIMQLEQQHYDLLLRLIQNVSTGNSGSATVPSAGAPFVIPSGSSPVADTPSPTAHKAPERTATVTGKVQSPNGVSEVYVFAQNVRSPAARGRVAEIAQRDRQFVPSTVVVQRGTRVVFPNYDAVFHNVFSSSPVHPFDLGSYRAGDSARAVEMTSLGVVDVFCNMHAKMHATILVVPGPIWTRVATDGTFRLDNVPLGTRKLIAWSPRSEPSEQTIDVGPTGGTATFTLGLQPERSHNNKYGLPYPQYQNH